MPIYYFEKEGNGRHGSFKANSDKEALNKKPVNCLVLYREREKCDCGLAEAITFLFEKENN